MAERPSIAIVVPTTSGCEHLPALLESVRALHYPAELVETIVVDNASSDGTEELLARAFPWVRALRQRVNLGFAAAVNAGAAATDADALAICNDDMRLDARWLDELVALYDSASGTPCVAGTILDWEGERIDFVGGFVNFHGFAGQERFGEPVEGAVVEDGRELPFACGGSMLVERRLFLELGGFDPAFFALLEDVDFGWRLRLAGHRTKLAARARSFHRHGATTGTLGEEHRLFLFERNALLMLLKNVGDANLPRFLAVAAFLLAHRAATAPPAGVQPPGLRAVADVAARLDEVLEERTRVQRLRRVDDREVLAVFGRPFFAASADEEYLGAAALLARVCGLDEILDEPGAVGGRTEEIRRLLELRRDRRMFRRLLRRIRPGRRG